MTILLLTNNIDIHTSIYTLFSVGCLIKKLCIINTAAIFKDNTKHMVLTNEDLHQLYHIYIKIQTQFKGKGRICKRCILIYDWYSWIWHCYHNTFSTKMRKRYRKEIREDQDHPGNSTKWHRSLSQNQFTWYLFGIITKLSFSNIE